MWYLKNKKPSQWIQKTDWWLTEAEGGEWLKWVKEAKRYKLTVIKKKLGHRNIMHSMAIVANNTVLYI